MAITNGYTTLAIAKVRLAITDATDDATLEAVIGGQRVSVHLDASKRGALLALNVAQVVVQSW